MTKKKLLVTVLIFSKLTLFAGNGTYTSPFTVAQAIAKTDGSAQTYWVKGYVVGEMSDFSNNKYFYELAPPFNGTSSYLIADNADEIVLSKCMPIQLSTAGSDSLTLDTHSKYWRKQIVTCGLLRDYFSMPGLKTLTALEVQNPSVWNNEAAAWNFFENMDGKYQAASSSSIFAGGTYFGDSGEWQLYGATWGDSSNDKKWGKASARLRLSGGSTGDPGYLQMNFDKLNGVGVIRFWAGYYDTDINGAIAVQTSVNSGKTWETVVSSLSIAKDWKEYQLTINQPGTLRIRIIKAETGSAGINIDKIRLSDYASTNEIISLTQADFRYHSIPDGIRLVFDNSNEKPSLYSVSGRKVWEASAAGSIFDIKISRGIFILKNKEKTCKIIVQ